MKKLILVLIILSFGFQFDDGGKKKSDIPLREIPKSDVFMQGFYWNSPPGGIWYDSLSNISVRLASAGFGAIWIPPAAKGAGSMSMGYDVYDHYDLGEYYQKGTLETRFGSRTELESMVSSFKEVGMNIFFDAVLNHAGNGDLVSQYECGPADSGYIVFNPVSQRFPKSAQNFHPNNIHCDNNAPYHDKMFFEDLCYYSGGTGDSLIAWADYLINVLGFDGFRLDAVKHIDPAFMTEFTSAFPDIYMAGEHWSSIAEIINYHNQVAAGGGHISLFDFPLRYDLKAMCNNTSGTYDMNFLDNAGLVNNGLSGFSVATFVENHDFDRIGWDGTVYEGHDPVLYDKDMAYAYIIFSEGRPSVFFKDYFDYDYAGKIDTLIWIRQNFLYGGTTKRNGLNPWYVGGNGTQQEQSQDIYVARRNGGNDNPQCYLVLNDHPTEWRGVWVDSDHPNEVFRDYTGVAIDKQAAADGRVELWAPPRGYALYVPDTTQTLNNPPVISHIPDLTAYTNSEFSYQVNVNDANNDPLNFIIEGNPDWLNLNNSGLLYGTPSFADTGLSTIIISVSDPSGLTDADTFDVVVNLNRSPVIGTINDTTIKTTIRYEDVITAIDQDNDSLLFSLTQSPDWLNIGNYSGLISGTPAVDDTGTYTVKIQVTDNKGGFDSTMYNLTVVENIDSVIGTYGKPNIDGNVTIGEDDWLEQWRLITDPDDDSFWHPSDSLDNELLALFATWDADSLYIGVDYVINDDYNTLMFYIDAGLPDGLTNFNSNSGYIGPYPKNFRFNEEDDIELFTAAYYLDSPSAFVIQNDTNAVDITENINSKRGNNARGSEIAIAWNEIYGLGAGLVPPNIKLKFVAAVAGGFNWGAGDSAPDNPDVDGDEGPDSLINLVSISPDEDGDGIPDPTIIITPVIEESENIKPDKFILHQNYPNPFNPLTKISFELPERSHIDLTIFDILGREIKVLINGERKAGVYHIDFNASFLPSGVYFYRFTANNFSSVKKMILLK